MNTSKDDTAEPLRVIWFVPPAVALVARAMNLPVAVAVADTRATSSDAQFDALSSGACDVVVTAMDNVFAWNRRAGPADFRIVAQIERTTPLTVIGRPGLKGLRDLQGADILVDAPGNGFVVALRALLANAGLLDGSYRLKPSGGVKERLDGLLAKSGDATLLGPPFDAVAVAAGYVLLARVQDTYPGFPGQGVVVREGELHRLRPRLQRWLAALEQARVQMDDPAVAKAHLASSGAEASAIDPMLALRPLSLRPDRAGLDLLIEQRKRLGLPGSEDRYENLVNDSLLAQRTEE